MLYRMSTLLLVRIAEPESGDTYPISSTFFLPSGVEPSAPM